MNKFNIDTFLSEKNYDEKTCELFKSFNVVDSLYKKNKDSLILKIENEKILPLEVVRELVAYFKAFGFSHVRLYFNVKDDELSHKEINTIVQGFKDSYHAFNNALVVRNDNGFTLSYIDDDAYEKDREFIDDLKLFFYDLGYRKPIEMELKHIDEEPEIEVRKPLEVVSSNDSKPSFNSNNNSDGKPKFNNYKRKTVEYKPVIIDDLDDVAYNVKLSAQIFKVDERTTRTGIIIQMIYLKDTTNACIAKMMEGKRFSKDDLKNNKEGKWCTVYGNYRFNTFSNDYEFEVDAIEYIDDPSPLVDDEEEKRIELHAHTKLSEMDGVSSPTDLVKAAYKYGHKAVAITDHLDLQGFHEAFLTYKGIKKGSDRQTLGGNIDLIYRTGKFQFSNKLSIDYLDTNNPSVSFAEYAMANPYYKKYGADGKINKYLYYPEEGLNDNPVSNPLWNASLNNYDKGQRFGFTNNFIAEWFATDDLRVRGKFGMTKYDDTQDLRLSPKHTDFDDKDDTQKGLFTHSLQKYLYYEGDISATYGKLIADKHQINAVLGFNFNNTTSKTNGYSATGFTDDQFAAPSFANNYPTGGKPRYNENIKHASSFYLNGGYAYDNRYLLDFNLRNDGASMFGTDNRFRTTWSVGLGWNIHNEKWMQENEAFQLLKLRASVGNPGNQNFSAYQAYTTYMFNSLMTNVFGTGVVISGLGNNDLAWQETINYNIGADVTTLGNRLNVTLDYYIKNTDPLLAIITTPGSMGVTSEALNAGKQKTTGWEATVKFSPIYMPENRINWNISLSATHSESKYADIGNAFSALNESGKAGLHNTTRYYDGGSPTAIWAVRSAGIDPATGKELFIKRDGTYSFTYDASDEVVCGDEEPDVEGLLGTTFYYKGFSFGCYFRYQYGGQLFNSSLFDKVENIGSSEVYNNQDRRALYDRWSVNNRNALYKGISMVQKTDKSSRFVMDENTLTCESVNVGYEFPSNIAKKLGMQALNVQATMNDIFRWSTVKAERGIDYPFARTVSFSLGATF